MNILIVSSYLPFPLYSGGHIRLYNLIKELSKKHAITLVCEKRPYQTKQDKDEVAKFCKEVITVQRREQWTIKNILQAGFSLNPFLVVGHKHNEMKAKINEVLKRKTFDLIHVETFYVLQNVPKVNIPIVLAEHNIEYLVYNRYKEQANFLLRPFLYLDVKKLKYKEIQAWKRVEQVIAVSEEEKIKMKLKDVEVVPNGVDLSLFQFRKSRVKAYHSLAKQAHMPQKDFLFIGDFSWIQNRDTVKWILNDIWPYLLRAVEGEVKINLHIAGRHIPQSIRALNKYDSIIFNENSPNTVEIFKNTDILLAPIKVGGGTSYKILEAMASGVPVVTTDLGIKGLEAASDVHAVTGNDTQTLIERITRLLRDRNYYEKIAENARNLIEEKYNWEVIAKKLDSIYSKISKN